MPPGLQSLALAYTSLCHSVLGSRAGARNPRTTEVPWQVTRSSSGPHEVKQGAQLLLEDVDLVPLHGIQVVVQRQQHLWSRSRRRVRCRRGSLCLSFSLPAQAGCGLCTRKDPNMAMEDRKCQMSWSSKKSRRMQSRLCSLDSAGVFCGRKAHSSLLNLLRPCTCSSCQPRAPCATSSLTRCPLPDPLPPP